MSELLDRLRSELDDVTQNTVARVAVATFGRIHGRTGELVTVLKPTDEQREAAAVDHERLTGWTRTVTAILRRRGAVVETKEVTRLTEELSRIVLLQREDVEDIHEDEWRRGFKRDLLRNSRSLRSILDRAAAAFDVPAQQQELPYLPFDVRISQVTPAYFHVAVPALSDSILAGDVFSEIRIDADIEAIAAAGQVLFRTLFPQPLADAYFAACRAAADAGQRLRVQLHLDDAGRFASAPFEMLHDGSRFLALSRESSIVRCVDIADAPRSFSVESPLRVLLTVSSPRLVPWLDGPGERERIEGAVAPLVMKGLLEMDVTPDGSMSSLRRRLGLAHDLGRPYHIWHFIGHGEFDEVTGLGALAMTDEEHEPHYAGGWELGTLFRDHPEVRFVFLNACDGARGSPGRPMSGVATALVQAGVPAVMAMQYAISGRAAGVLAEELYGAFADGAALDDAVREARRGIFYLPDATEWITPVVHVRGPANELVLFGRSGRTQK